MKDFITSLNLDWNEVIITLWTAILLPILTNVGREIRKYAEAKKIAKYTDILQNNVTSVVKDVYETIVKEIKGTEEWTEEKKDEIREIAKNKIIFALSTTAYECLKTANEDFEEYLDSLIESSLYDLKKNK